MKKINTPTIIIIFGATGDLSQRKLIPALMDLDLKNVLPDDFKILGFSRREYSDEDYKGFVLSSIKNEKHNHGVKDAKKFAKHVVYKQGDFTNLDSYKALYTALKKIDNEFGVCSNKLFYLAVPPLYYETIIKNLAKTKLNKPCSSTVGWTRVLVEKPFGKDVKTSQHLDHLLDKLFQEEQIFRIDHYLAKETIQNILSFRFSNSIFEPVWNNKHIEQVRIKFYENLDVANRGSFYDGVGALRDVGQNHILQMLALIAMDNPRKISFKSIREARARVMKDLKCFNKKSIKNSVIRGQYIGFKKTKGVDKKLTTETYFKVKAFVDNKRWSGVPFYLESGKALKDGKVEIEVLFKPVTPCFCNTTHKEHNHQNIITFKIQPEKEIQVRFWAKQPGLEMDIEPKDLFFSYGSDVKNELNAYEKVLFDCISGDQTLFASSDEINLSWKFIESILNNWKSEKLYEYKKGSDPEMIVG